MKSDLPCALKREWCNVEMEALLGVHLLLV